MYDDFINSGVAILTAIVALAILAVVLSKKSDTTNVIQSAGAFISSIISKAVSPVSQA
jgi:flavin reductase (DIM6/NTAB) family NADH-FMN oxidoreductase RutF